MEEKEVFEPMPAEQETETAETNETAKTTDETISEARRNILVGLLWCIGGLAFSFISYYLTEAGSRYVVATGAIVWGALQAIKGVAAYLQAKRAQGDGAACRKAIVLTIGTAVAIAGLGYASWRTVHADEVRIVEEEQTYDCPELGLRVTIPGGFTELETEVREETDTTYAHYRSFAGNGTLAIITEGTAGNLDEEVRTVDDVAEFLTAEAEKFFDAGIEDRSFVEIGGIRMLKHTGSRVQTPEWKTVMYDLVHNGSLITLYYGTRTGDPSREADTFVKEQVTLY
ncbi:MAG: hypothetical protein NC209_03475 [Alistipes sp.]|nr:hypothetical protein [Alistipes senegalensis]MCM1250192.1 hypothetical protein [Alistipes sp.]